MKTDLTKLGWLLVLAGTFSVLYGVYLEARQTPAEVAEVKAVVEKLGGTVTLDAKGNIVAVDLNHTAVSDKDLLVLKVIQSLQSLQLGNTSITDQGLANLGSYANLSHLDLSQTGVTNAGLQTLFANNNYANLTNLDLQNTRITDQGLRHLQHLTLLHTLSLGGNAGITNAGLVHLEELRRLQRLNLTGTGVTGVKVLELRKRLKAVRHR